LNRSFDCVDHDHPLSHDRAERNKKSRTGA
jgi:hypothetical protein